jgi:hypothetical protein
VEVEQEVEAGFLKAGTHHEINVLYN